MHFCWLLFGIRLSKMAGPCIIICRELESNRWHKFKISQNISYFRKKKLVTERLVVTHFMAEST